MKIETPMMTGMATGEPKLGRPTAGLGLGGGGTGGGTPALRGAGRGGFTMIEIALCLAIMGFALVSILLVLPWGMNSQKDTRQETIIGQDASVLMEAIRGGARGMDDLTNYVYAIVITNMTMAKSNCGYLNQALAAQMNFKQSSFPSVPAANWYNNYLTNGANIVGLLSTPEYTDDNGQPVYDNLNYASPYPITNYIRAYVCSISGLAAEKPPQNSDVMVGNTFAYRLICVNAPVANDPVMITNLPKNAYARELANNLRELRLYFSWPLLPSGNVGDGAQNFRTAVAGQMYKTNVFDGPNLYFYQGGAFATNR